jgi:hypothetical protein
MHAVAAKDRNYVQQQTNALMTLCQSDINEREIRHITFSNI